ncbi:hypothetical protein RB195_007802 [Necator americanus]|uniref:Secreted protein n=1 Tax=Necator americanus TaxID=51031 RepID=A0ABR1C296_NECAM
MHPTYFLFLLLVIFATNGGRGVTAHPVVEESKKAVDYVGSTTEDYGVSDPSPEWPPQPDNIWPPRPPYGWQPPYWSYPWQWFAQRPWDRYSRHH